MRTIRFTKAVHQELPVPDAGKRLEYADSVVNELRLRVTSSGSKSFCVSRKRDVKFYRVTLGKFPDMTIEQARERVYNALSEVAITRRNPNERRREEKKWAVTLSDALDEYIKSRLATGRIKKRPAKNMKTPSIIILVTGWFFNFHLSRVKWWKRDTRSLPGMAYGLVARSGVKKKAVKPRLIYGRGFCVRSTGIRMIIIATTMATVCCLIRPRWY